MGKTKTAFVSGTTDEVKSSAEKYAEKKAKKAALEQKQEVKQVLQVEQVSQEEKPAITEAVESEAPKKIEKILTVSTRGKKYLEAKAKINRQNQYKLPDAIDLIKELNTSKFDATLELHLTVKKIGTSINCSLPYSFGKQKKIEVATEATIEKLKLGKVDFDVLLATPEMMPKLVAFARLLGPKGLMPNPKNGTIIKTVKDADKFKGDTKTVKTEKEQPLIHTSFGKISMKSEELVKNAETILNALGGSKTIIKAFISATMTPSVKIQV